MIPDRYCEYWKKFAKEQDVDPTPRFTGAFRFAGPESTADELAEIVVAGRKRASASLLWAYESEGERIPRTGDLSIVTDFQGNEVCVIQTLQVDIVPFLSVTAEFADLEGEGDRSLLYWQKTHMAFFELECKRIGRSPSLEMPVICECFEVVYWRQSPGNRP
jgi:uncharacterized protein YhfF